jgi:hypothetical protein
MLIAIADGPLPHVHSQLYQLDAILLNVSGDGLLMTSTCSVLQRAVVSPKNSLFTPPATASAPGTIGPILFSDKLSVYSLWMAPIFADNMTVAFKVILLLPSAEASQVRVSRS